MANLIFGGADSYRETEEALSRLAARVSEAVSELQAARHFGLSGVANESAQNIVGQALTAAARLVESIRIVAAFIGSQADSLKAAGTLGSAFF